MFLETLIRQSDSIKSVIEDAVSPPTLLAGVAFVVALVQGALALESVDPCRLSRRKMNILLAFEVLEVGALVASETFSFIELRGSLQKRLVWLHWIAPVLLAAGICSVLVDAYFTLAVVAKSRILWLPMSTVGEERMTWGLIPFVFTTAGALALIGWRVGWWWKPEYLSDQLVRSITMKEQSLSTGVMGFAVGWTLAVSAIVLLVVFMADFSEDGANYLFSIMYLWRPDDWLGDNPGTVRVWYRKPSEQLLDHQFEAAERLDKKVGEVPRVYANWKQRALERGPLHVGNAIVGDDANLAAEEDPSARIMHLMILFAEHATVLPLLITVIVAVSRLHLTLDKETEKLLQQLADAVIVLSFLELALGIKNFVWGIRGTSENERAVPLIDESGDECT